jgi:hypothetical protein
LQLQEINKNISTCDVYGASPCAVLNVNYHTRQHCHRALFLLGRFTSGCPRELLLSSFPVLPSLPSLWALQGWGSLEGSPELCSSLWKPHGSSQFTPSCPCVVSVANTTTPPTFLLWDICQATHQEIATSFRSSGFHRTCHCACCPPPAGPSAQLSKTLVCSSFPLTSSSFHALCFPTQLSS